MTFPILKMKPHEERRVRAGHPWVFSNEIEPPEAPPPVGSIVDVRDSRGKFVGRGFYHPHSLICVRLLVNEPLEIDAGWFEKRIAQALALRNRLYPETSVYRLVFGESDRLPGLIIDRYGDYASIQYLSAGMEARHEDVMAALRKAVELKGAVLRKESHLRALEGLTGEGCEAIFGEIPPSTEIQMDGVRYVIPLLGGQKTGFFLDQRENRKLLASFCEGKEVMDAFCYSGGFGLSALARGASRAVFVDESEEALGLADQNLNLNGLKEKAELVCSGAVSVLEKLAASETRLDVIVLDPPAFARARKHLPKAVKSYEKINALAMRGLKRGGLLATSSCSHHLEREAFFAMLRSAAAKAGKTAKVLFSGGQSPDHPILLAMPETDYLKFAILEVG